MVFSGGGSPRDSQPVAHGGTRGLLGGTLCKLLKSTPQQDSLWAYLQSPGPGRERDTNKRGGEENG